MGKMVPRARPKNPLSAAVLSTSVTKVECATCVGPTHRSEFALNRFLLRSSRRPLDRRAQREVRPSAEVYHTNALSVWTSRLSWFINLELTGKGLSDTAGMTGIDSSIREQCANGAVGVTAMLFHYHRAGTATISDLWTYTRCGWGCSVLNSYWLGHARFGSLVSLHVSKKRLL
jgi:hypothetical protein